ncbi:MAG: hypothetical protein ACK5LE_04450 [Alphaproteobacteria bacterium]
MMRNFTTISLIDAVLASALRGDRSSYIGAVRSTGKYIYATDGHVMVPKNSFQITGEIRYNLQDQKHIQERGLNAT